MNFGYKYLHITTEKKRKAKWRIVRVDCKDVTDVSLFYPKISAYLLKVLILYKESKGHPCTGTEALYRLYGP
jgi:hypothetical protein